jgi:hypothetical protein
VALLFDDPIVTGLIDSLQRDSIRSPSKYVKGVIRKACEERGVDHVALLAAFPQAPATKEKAEVVK